MFYTVFGRDNCVFCKRAVALLEKRGKKFAYIDLEEGDNLEEMKAWVAEFTDVPPKTIPQIFAHGKYVGGFTEMAALPDLQEEIVLFGGDL